MIDLILGPRISGKTTELIKEAVAKDLYIVVADFNRAQVVGSIADEMLREKEIPHKCRYPVTVYEMQQMFGRQPLNPETGRPYNYLVDDLDAVLSRALGANIETATATALNVRLLQVPDEEKRRDIERMHIS